MPLNHCFGCHCGLSGSVLDVFYFCPADFSLVHLHGKRASLYRLFAQRAVQLSAGHYSKCVIIHLDHKLAITLAYVVII